MFSSLFSGFQSGFNRSLQQGLKRGLDRQSAALDQRQRLLDQAGNDRIRRRLATRSARQRRRQREQDDRLRSGQALATAAGSGLRLRASSKADTLLAQTARQANATAQATSILDEALRDRLSRAALRRHGRALTH